MTEKEYNKLKESLVHANLELTCLIRGNKPHPLELVESRKKVIELTLFFRNLDSTIEKHGQSTRELLDQNRDMLNLAKSNICKIEKYL